MSAILYLILLLCALLPLPYLAAGMLPLWMLQTAMVSEDPALMHAGPIDLMPTDFMLALVLARTAFDVLLRRELRIDRPFFAALGFYVAVMALASLVASVEFGMACLTHAVTALARLCSEMFLALALAHSIATPAQARRCLGIVAVTLTTLAIIQFVNYVGAPRGFIIGEVQGIERGELRFFGPVGDSIGSVLLLGYAVALCRARLAGAALALGGILLTAGVGAMLSASAATVLFLLFAARSIAVREFLEKNLRVLPVLGIVCIVAALCAAQPVARMLRERAGSGSYANSGAQRVANATLAFAMIERHPVFGVGFMGYQAALASVGGAKYFDVTKRDGGTANANNQILQTLCDGGLAGFLAFLAVIAVAVRLCWRIAARSEDRFVQAFYLGALVWLIAEFFGNQGAVWLIPSSYVARLIWVIAGVGAALERFQEEDLSGSDGDCARLNECAKHFRIKSSPARLPA